MPSSSPGDGRQSGGKPTRDGAQSSNPGGVSSEKLGRDLLDSVLHQTAQTTASADAPTKADLTALRNVAARYRGQPLALQPVVVELVEAVLSEQFKPVVASPESWQAMCSGIAQTLYEDPVSRDRLDVLWSRLSKETA